MEIGELGAEGVIEVRYVSKTAIERHVENLGRNICQRAEVSPSWAPDFLLHQRK